MWWYSWKGVLVESLVMVWLIAGHPWIALFWALEETWRHHTSV